MPILAQLKPQPLILGHQSLYQSNFMNAYQCLTQLWKQTLLLPLGILPFPPLLLPQEKHLLTCHHRSKPPWSWLQLRHTVDRPHLSRRPQLPSHLVRHALHSHTICLVWAQVLHSLTPLYRLWVWGQGSLTLLCKVNLGALPFLLILFLTLEVISLLRPLRLVVCISSPPGSLHT